MKLIDPPAPACQGHLAAGPSWNASSTAPVEDLFGSDNAVCSYEVAGLGQPNHSNPPHSQPNLGSGTGLEIHQFCSFGAENRKTNYSRGLQTPLKNDPEPTTKPI